MAKNSIIGRLISDYTVQHLIVLIIIFSFILTVIFSFFQLSIDYHADKNRINKAIKQIETSNLVSLSNNLWDLNLKQVQLQLDGFLQFPFIEMAQVVENSSTVKTAGKQISKEVLIKEFSLYKNNKQIGKLVIFAGIDQIYARLVRTFFSNFLDYAIKIFLVSGFSIFILHKLMIKHIAKISNYLSNLNMEELEAGKLELDRKSLKPGQLDSLEKLVFSINSMKNRLNDSYIKLESFKSELEVKVDNRTQELKKAKEEAENAKEEAENAREEAENAREEAENAREEAETASKAKSLFLANMSHEIRTPMNAILGFSEIMMDRASDDQMLNYASLINSSGKSLLSLINDILDLSKVESGKSELEYSAVSIETLIKEMEIIFGPQLSQKNLEFKFHIPSDLPKSLVLDEIRLRQVLINLVGNAIKFTDSGYIEVSVFDVSSNSISRSSVNFSLKIADSGKGISKDDQAKIFSAFSQVEGQKYSRYGGTGLGLAISQKLMELMGGGIAVESELDKGSVFSLYFKNIEVALAEELEDRDDNFDYSNINFHKSRLLVADDISFNRELIIGMLERFDFDIIEARSGSEVLELVKKHEVDLILMDIRMPEMNGYEALHILKNTPSYKDTPVIAITASVMKEDIKHLENEFDSYLMKPISKLKLIKELTQYIPYSVIEKSEIKSTPISSYIEADFASNDFSELFNILSEKYCDFDDFSSVDKVEKIAEEVNLIGVEYKCDSIIDWSNKLKKAAGQYDIEEMQSLLGIMLSIINDKGEQ